MADAEAAALEAPQPGANTAVEPPTPPERGPTTTATSQPEGAPPAAEVAPPKEPPTPPAPPAKPRDFAAERMQGRIDRLTAEKARLEAEVAKARAGTPPDVAAQVEARANEIATAKATEIAAWQSFTTSLNATIVEAQKEFGAEKADAAVAKLRTLHDHTDAAANAAYLGMLQAMIDTGAAPKLIMQLGEDPSEAARIMGLSPTKMGVELGRLAFRDAELVSAAPKPLTPISGAGRNHVAVAAEDPERADALDMRVWMERRAGHVNEVNKRAGRRVLP